MTSMRVPKSKLKQWSIYCSECGFSWTIVTVSMADGNRAEKAAERRHRRQHQHAKVRR